MPNAPYAKLQVSVNGGAPQSGGVTAPSGATLQFSGESTVGWLRARFEIIDYPEGFSAPAGWSTSANGTIYCNVTGPFTPPAFALPAAATRWGKWEPRLLVNEQLDSSNLVGDGSLYDGRTIIETVSPNLGLHDVAALEGDQFTDAVTRIKGWIRSLQRNLRLIDNAGGGGGGSGTPGADGKTVRSGSGAPSGGLGTDGDFYINTSVWTIYGPKTGGAWGGATSIIGPQGATGATGASGSAGAAGTNGFSVRSGSGAPSGGLGADGDFYIRTSDWTLYGPKTSGAWGSPTSLVGPTGATGATGPAGAGTPAGTNGQFQYNGAGAFAATPNSTFVSTSVGSYDLFSIGTMFPDQGYGGLQFYGANHMLTWKHADGTAVRAVRYDGSKNLTLGENSVYQGDITIDTTSGKTVYIRTGGNIRARFDDSLIQFGVGLQVNAGNVSVPSGNVIAGGGYVQAGSYVQAATYGQFGSYITTGTQTSVATVGHFRVADSTTPIIATSGNRVLLAANATELFIGMDTSYVNAVANVRIQPTSNIILGPGAGGPMYIGMTTGSPGQISMAVPIGGTTGVPLRYRQASVTMTSNQTLSGTQQGCMYIDANGATSQYDIIGPALADATFNVRNNSPTFSVNFTTTAGGGQVTISPLTSKWVRCNSTATAYEARS